VTELKTYRKRPVEVQAMQWDGRAMGATHVIDWILTNHGSANYECDEIPCHKLASDFGHHIKIRTADGSVRVPRGHFVVLEDGEFRPVDPAEFEKTYEVVE
jgi:hypothetical protein